MELRQSVGRDREPQAELTGISLQSAGRNQIVEGPPFFWRTAQDPSTNCPQQVSDLDAYIPHQANVRIISHVARKLGLPESKCIVTVDKHANTSAASVPLALDVAVRDGRIKRGDTVLLQGVGGGFTWGSVLLKY